MRYRGHSRLQRAQLQVEPLEDRLLLSTLVWTSPDHDLSIPDLGTRTSTVSVDDTFTVGEVRVLLDIEHAFAADLDVFLVGPDGARIELFTDVGGSGENFTATVLHDAAAVSIASGSAPFDAGPYRPEGRLAAFVGTNAHGTWTLEISDDVQVDAGVLRGWSLSLVPASVVAAADVPQRIPAGTATAGAITSTLTVADDFTIRDVNVLLDADHTFDADLRVSLTGPDGTRVTLLSGVGGSGNNFTGTLLDDEAGRPVTAGNAPFRGSFHPAEILSVFDGRDARGDWTLTVEDTATADVGELRSWSLVFERPLSELPDLVGERFRVTPDAVNWGGAVRIDYALANRGEQDAGPFDVELWLAPHYTLDGSAILLQTLSFPGLPARTSTSGTMVVTLPGQPGNEPPGFTGLDHVVLGFQIDPNDTVAEEFESNNSGRADGFDSGGLTIAPGRELEGNDTRDLANPTYPGTVVQGAIHPDGDVDVFLLEIPTGGYLTVEVTPTTDNSLDPYLELYGVDSLLVFQGLRIAGGGLLVASDDRAVGDVRPLIRQYVLPGRYYLAVSGSGGESGGAYVLANRLELDPNDPFDVEQTLLSRLQVGQDPRGVVAGDFNRDSVLDLATANRGSTNVSILLGVGDGSFQPQAVYDVPGLPEALGATDVNSDGRLDLLTLDGDSGRVAVLLGTGDGRFARLEGLLDRDDPRVVELFQAPIDLPDAGSLRIPLTIRGNVPIRDVNVLLNIEHSRASDLDVFLVSPAGTRVELFTDIGGRGANFANLVLDDEGGDPVTASFPPYDGEVLRPEGRLADFDGENAVGTWFLEISDDATDRTGRLRNWSLLFNDSEFSTNFPTTLVLGDFNRDGNLDGAGTRSPTGQPPFDDRLFFVVGAPLEAGAQVDLGKSSFADLLPILGLPEMVGVDQLLIGTPLLMADRNSSNPPRATPLVGDLTGDGVDDVLVLSRAGDILLRPGRVDRPGLYGAPVVVNEDPALPRAREVAIVSTGAGARIAALDLLRGTVSVYSAAGGTWRATTTLPVGVTPFRIAAGDLDRDGLPDLAVGNAVLGVLALYRGMADGGFEEGPQLKVGLTVGDLELRDVDRDGWLDLLVADVASSTVSILHNEKLPSDSLAFAPELRYRAAAVDTDGVYGVVELASNIANDALRYQAAEILARFGITNPALVAAFRQQFLTTDPFPHQFFLYALHETREVTAGDFTGDGVEDLVAINYRTNSVSLFVGKPTGGFVDPRTFATGTHPVGLHAAQLDDDNRDNRIDDNDFLDLIVLTEGAVGEPAAAHVYRGNGAGRFIETLSVDLQGVPQPPLAGNVPTGLTTADVTRPDGGGPDGLPDLLIGNEFGDLLVLAGNGDGAFRPFVRADRRVSFLATDLDGDGTVDVVLADQARDAVRAQLRVPGTADFNPGAFARQGSDLIGPGDVAETDVDGDGRKDLLFANTGSNNVLVYLRQANGAFSDRPLSFFVGTSPVALHVADFNGDGRPDLAVANQGSNDVSVLLGNSDHDANSDGAIDAQDLFRLGQRLQTGGSGPNAVTSIDLDGDGIRELLVTNGHSGTLATIPGNGSGGVGNGNFLDNQLSLQPLTAGPTVQTQVVSPTLGFARTPLGTLVRFNPTTRVTEPLTLSVGAVSTFRAVSTSAVPAPLLFVADRDGAVSMLLNSGGATTFDAIRTTNTELGSLSALEVLQFDETRFEAYLADAGQVRPLVLTFDLQAELTVFDSPFALVPTLVTALEGVQLNIELPLRAVPLGSAVEVFNPLFAAQLMAGDFRRGPAVGLLEDDDVLTTAGEELVAALLVSQLRLEGDLGLDLLLYGGDAETSSGEAGNGLPALEQMVTGTAEALERRAEKAREGTAEEAAEGQPIEPDLEERLRKLLESVRELTLQPQTEPPARKHKSDLSNPESADMPPERRESEPLSPGNAPSGAAGREESFRAPSSESDGRHFLAASLLIAAGFLAGFPPPRRSVVRWLSSS